MKKLTALLFTAAFCSGAALAAEDFDFDTADANSDGQLSETEVMNDTRVSTNFDTWDENGDGFLDQAEVDAGLSMESATEVETIGDEQSTDEQAADPMYDDAATEEPQPVSSEDEALDPQPVSAEDEALEPQPVDDTVEEGGSEDGLDDGALDDNAAIEE